jgi:LacI family transcriptional regulator
MKKKSTISDIAKKLNVTPSTVSRALGDHPRISDSTKKAVLKVAHQLNYQPNTIASALRKGKSNILGVIVPASDRQFFASIIRGIEEIARNEGYNLIICQSDEQTAKEKEKIDALLQIQVDGIIASVAKETTDYSHFMQIIDREVPLVLYDRVGELLNVNAVVSNDYSGAYKAVEHLIEQGCRRIVHFAGEQHIGIYQQRLKGYIDALKDHQLPVDRSLIIESDLIGDTTQIVESGRKMTEKILKFTVRPDGIFSASDFAAMGAIKTLKHHNIAIPEEIALFGYSNDFASSVIEPGLSSVDQHTKKMGNITAQHFFKELYAKPGVKFQPQKTLLAPSLVIRASSLRRGKLRNSDTQHTVISSRD